MDSRYLMNRFVPDFLLEDLKSNTGEENPFYSALKEGIEEAANHSRSLMNGLHFGIENEEVSRVYLNRFGFFNETLSSPEILKLMFKMKDLLRRPMSLVNLEWLATLFLGNCTVHRGLPYEVGAMPVENSSEKVRMLHVGKQGNERDHLFVRCRDNSDKARQAECYRNLKRLLGREFTVIIAPSKKFIGAEPTVFPSSGFRLSSERKLGHVAF